MGSNPTESTKQTKIMTISNQLRWLETVSGTFQDLQFDGSL